MTPGGENRLEAWLSAHEDAAPHLLAHSGVDAAPGDALGAVEAPPDWGYGPAPHDPALAEAVAAAYGVPADEVLVTVGASEADLLAAMAILAPGDLCLVEAPTYPPLAQGPRAVGARVEPLPRRYGDGFRVDVDAVEAALAAGARMVAITDLHNPSGARIPVETIRRLGDLCADRDAWLLVDEVFHELALEPRPTARRLHPRVVAAHSLTKCHGLPGLRTGWLLAPPEVLAPARDAKALTSITNAPVTQRLATRALAKRDALLERARGIRDANLPRLRAAMAELPLAWVEPAGGVTCAPRLPAGWDDEAFARALLAAEGVLVVPGAYLGLPGHIRVGFGGEPAAFEAALTRFAAFTRAYAP